MRLAFGVMRLLAAGVSAVALTARLEYSLGFAGSAVVNYFSYFTTLSAIGATILWVFSGVIAFRRRLDRPWLRNARTFVTTYQIASGVVFYLIVAGANATDYRLVVPVSDQFLHYWLPMYAVFDWLFAPGRGRVRWQLAPWVLVFPLVWGGYTMLRGQAVGWYPYFFLDPAQLSGVGEFVAYTSAVVAFMILVAGFLTAISRVLPPGVRHPEQAVARATKRQAAPGAGGLAEGPAEPEPGWDEIAPVRQATSAPPNSRQKAGQPQTQ